MGTPSESRVTVKKVLYLAIAQLLDGRIVARPFHAAVPASVVVGAVAIVFAVRFVVLLVVGDQIVQREAVVARDEIDALLGFALLVAVDVGTADQPVGEARRPSLLRRGRSSRTSSRNRPFHSFQLSPMKLPTW